jgi:hypothetical protein
MTITMGLIGLILSTIQLRRGMRSTGPEIAGSGEPDAHHAE